VRTHWKLPSGQRRRHARRLKVERRSLARRPGGLNALWEFALLAVAVASSPRVGGVGGHGAREQLLEDQRGGLAQGAEP